MASCPRASHPTGSSKFEFDAAEEVNLLRQKGPNPIGRCQRKQRGFHPNALTSGLGVENSLEKSRLIAGQAFGPALSDNIYIYYLILCEARAVIHFS